MKRLWATLAVCALVAQVAISHSSAALAQDSAHDKALDAYVHGDRIETVKLYRQGAQAGDPRAQTSLGQMHEAGYGVPQDYAEAAKWYRLAAEQGHVDAQVKLANLYVDGRGVAQNHTEAAQWFRLAAEKDDTEAQTQLGYQYLEGLGVEQSYGKARKFLLPAAEQGKADAQYYLGTIFSKGLGVQPNDDKAAEWYHLAAEQGHAQAQYNLGRLYSTRRISGSVNVAVKWYREAAERNLAKAQRRLGLAYMRGRGVKADWVKALMWLSLAEAHGDIAAKAARFSLAQLMSNEQVAEAEGSAEAWLAAFHDRQERLMALLPDGTRVADSNPEVALKKAESALAHADYDEAFNWYLAAAEQGDSTAQYRLGTLYSKGLGVPQNYAQAARWFRRASQPSHSYPREELLALCETRGLLPAEFEKTVIWLHAAAEAGHLQGGADLAILYDCGLGVPQDKVAALMWYDIAAVVSGEEVKARYNDYAAQMTTAEVAGAKDRARAWLKAFHARRNSM